MKSDEAPAHRPGPRHARHEPEDRDDNGAADDQVRHHAFELAGNPGRAAAARLKGEKQVLRCAQDDKETIHRFMIRGADPPGLPFDPLDVPFGESSLSSRNPATDVALPHCISLTSVPCLTPRDSPGQAAFPST